MDGGNKQTVEFNIKPRDSFIPKTALTEIELPSPEKKPRQLPIMLQIGGSLAMVSVMLVGITLRATMSSNPVMAVISSITVFGSLFGMIAIPILTRRYNARVKEEDELSRQQEYREILARKAELLEAALEKEKAYYDAVFPPVARIVNLMADFHYKSDEKGKRFETTECLWGIRALDEDFMILCVGKGAARPATSVKLKNSDDEALLVRLEKDPMYAETKKITGAYGRVEDMPVVIDLKSEVYIGIAGDADARRELTMCMAYRLAFAHPYAEAKLVFITSQDDAQLKDFARFLPHAWDNERSRRYILDNPEDINRFTEEILSPIVKKRREDKDGKSWKSERFLPHFVLFIMTNEENNAYDWQTTNLYSEFFRVDADMSDLGVSFIVYAAETAKLHKFCDTRVLTERKTAGGALWQKSLIKHRRENFAAYFEADAALAAERLPGGGTRYNLLPFNAAARNMFRVRIQETDRSGQLPDSLTFFETYAKLFRRERLSAGDLAGKMPLAPILGITKGIVAYIGITASGAPLALNLAENKDGPHGLIGGTTGSGKSELIASIVLSLAINYSPQDVAFFMIDFKGGGLSGQFKDLPHLAGAFTNLGKNEAARTLKALRSESDRRQAMFANVGAKDVGDYNTMMDQRGEPANRLPHLIIIVDEFAELKASAPDFLHEIISLARVGRSLGIHLILATQKPSGNISEEIQSNSNFRIALKMAKKEDSKDVIGENGAVDIKNPGGAYVKTSVTTPKLVQTAYSGAEDTDDPEKMALSKALMGRVGLTGVERMMPVLERDENAATQLDSALNAICAVRYKPSERLLLCALPDKILPEDVDSRFAGDACGFGGAGSLVVAAGKYDDVEKHVQPPLRFDFMKGGNMCVFGGGVSGKTTFLQTVLYSLARAYSPEDVHFYIWDGGSALAMDGLRGLPHVGGLISTRSNYFTHIGVALHGLTKELKARERCLMVNSASSIAAYNRDRAPQNDKLKKLPHIFVVIDDIKVFENCVDRDDRYANMITLLRDGNKNGIIFLVTARASADLKHSFAPYFQTRVTLALGAGESYGNALGTKNFGLALPEIPGRGFVKMDKRVLEFQTAVVAHEADEDKTIEAVAAKIAAIRDGYQVNAEYLPRPFLTAVPDTLEAALEDLSVLKRVEAGQLLLGYNDKYEPVFAESAGLFAAVSQNTRVLAEFLEGAKGMYQKMGVPDDHIFACGSEMSAEDVTALLNGFAARCLENRDQNHQGAQTLAVLLIEDIAAFYAALPDPPEDAAGKPEPSVEQKLGYLFEHIDALNAAVFASGSPRAPVWDADSFKTVLRNGQSVVFGMSLNMFPKLNAPGVSGKELSAAAGAREAHFVGDGQYTRLMLCGYKDREG